MIMLEDPNSGRDGPCHAVGNSGVCRVDSWTERSFTADMKATCKHGESLQ